MKRRVMKILAVLLSVLLIPMHSIMAAQLMPENESYGDDLRVGLTSKYENLWSITLDNPVIAAGFERNGRFSSEFTVRGGDKLVVSADSRYYVSVDFFNSYEKAKAFAGALSVSGYASTPALLGIGDWAVYVGGFDSASEAENAEEDLGGTTLRPSGRRMVLTDNNVPVCIFDSEEDFPQFTSSGERFINLGERQYRGRVEIMRQDGKNLTAVNVIGMEEYLYSVVPSEMPPTWSQEALRAQAVACRSYTVTRRTAHNSSGFDICDEGHCQNYLGVSSESDSTTTAVNATKDVMVWHDGKVVSAVYFSSSGGITEDSENVWVDDEPFLRSVLEEDEFEPKVWNRTFNLDDLSKALSLNNSNIGQAVDMEITLSENGRVQELTIYGTRGDIELEKENIRTFFSGLTGGSLESRNFTMATAGGGGDYGSEALVGAVGINGPTVGLSIGTLHVLGEDGIVEIAVNASNTMEVRAVNSNMTYSTIKTGAAEARPGDYILKGAGSGHGVGMSQRGAEGLAQKGWDYVRILEHYYTGVDIEK